MGPTKGTITLENGDMAAVCLDCFESLKNQFVEGAKYGVPVTKRQYNWMQIPPPPEDSVQLITPKERLDKHINFPTFPTYTYCFGINCSLYLSCFSIYIKFEFGSFLKTKY